MNNAITLRGSVIEPPVRKISKQPSHSPFCTARLQLPNEEEQAIIAFDDNADRLAACAPGTEVLVLGIFYRPWVRVEQLGIISTPPDKISLLRVGYRVTPPSRGGAQ